MDTRKTSWRPLLLGTVVSALVAGCNLAVNTATTVSPSAYPLVTLTIGRFSPPVTVSPAVTRAAAVPTERPTIPPTPIPTETPPPVYHTVTEGETLLDIALNYDIELSALRAANADQDLTLLQIGQRLIIPPTGAAVSPASAAFSPTPTPLPLSLRAPSCSPTRAGRILCLGQVENTTDVMLERLSVRVVISAPDGRSLDAVAVIEQAALPPAESAPYRVLFDAAWNEMANGLRVDARADLLSADAAPDAAARYALLAMQEAQISQQNGAFVVTAKIFNADSVPVAAPRVVITLRDSAGDVIGYRVLTLPETLQPGAVTAIRTMIVPSRLIDAPSFSIYAEGRKV